MAVRSGTGQNNSLRFIVTKLHFNSEIQLCNCDTVLVLLPWNFPFSAKIGLEDSYYLIHSKMPYKVINDRALVSVSKELLLKEALKATVS